MKKILFLFLLYSSATVANPLEVKCYNNTEFYKILKKEPLITLYNSTDAIGKSKELLIGLDKKGYLIEYQVPKETPADKADKYCVTGIVENITLNDKAIEFFYKVFEKLKGQDI